MGDLIDRPIKKPKPRTLRTNIEHPITCPANLSALCTLCSFCPKLFSNFYFSTIKLDTLRVYFVWYDLQLITANQTDVPVAQLDRATDS